MIILLIFLLPAALFSQKVKTDANIVGHVVCCGKHIPFANVVIKGTTIGTVTDETGHFQLVNLPVGNHTVVVSTMGYKPQEKDNDSRDRKKLSKPKFEIVEECA
ncbi:MAG: carboxypeptidase-like regulatory domain-containing protein [Bacteroidetes bacterium]|nr:carboxypeptidase-like regulatory domain-containing protein [Bacteroidota bacterium]